MDYRLELYRQMFVSIKRGNYRGVVSNAKPIFLLSLIEFSQYCKNRVTVDDTLLSNFYNSNTTLFGKATITPLVAPFFHMNSEPFYHLVWKEGLNPPPNAASPSHKFLRDNLLYAEIDDELWKLLQDKGNREYLKEAIINKYLITD